MFFIIRDETVLNNCRQTIQIGHAVKIEDYKKNRSGQQNKLYWSLLGIIAKDLGYDLDDLHTAVKVRFLGTEDKFIAGQPITLAKSTRKLNTKEFTELVDKVYALGAELNIKLPTPSHWGFDV